MDAILIGRRSEAECPQMGNDHFWSETPQPVCGKMGLDPTVLAPNSSHGSWASQLQVAVCCRPLMSTHERATVRVPPGWRGWHLGHSLSLRDMVWVRVAGGSCLAVSAPQVGRSVGIAVAAPLGGVARAGQTPASGSGCVWDTAGCPWMAEGVAACERQSHIQ